MHIFLCRTTKAAYRRGFFHTDRDILIKTLYAIFLFALTALSNPAQAQVQDEIRALFNHFIRECNAHNAAAVGQMLHDSRDFLWVGPRGAPVIGRDSTLQALTTAFRGNWRIEPELSALKITPLGDSAVRLHVPVKYTIGDAAQTEPYLLTQVYVKTVLGWIISSSVPVPLPR